VKKTIGKWLSILIPLALGVILIVYQYKSFTPTQLAEIKGYFKNADYFYIAISLFIALLGHLSRAYRWKYSLEHLGYTTKFHNNFMAVAICYFLNLTIPRSGEISRSLVLKKYENVPFDKSFGTIIGERVVDSLIFLLFIIVGFCLQYDILKNFILQTIPLQKLVILGVVGFLATAGFVLMWMYSSLAIILKLKSKLSGLIEGMTSILKMKTKWKYLFHSFFIWFSYLSMFYITIFALKETSNISINAVIIGFVFGTLAIGFTNSGFGAFPLIIAQIFLLYGISETVGTAFGWLVWTSQTALTILLGTLSFLFLPVLNRK
jgi:uncharacterized protein (TIRG00374 family)